MLGFLSCVNEFVLYLKSNRNLLYGFKQSNKIIRFVPEERSFWVVMWKLGRNEPRCVKTSWRRLESDSGASSKWRENGGFKSWLGPLHNFLSNGGWPEDSGGHEYVGNPNDFFQPPVCYCWGQNHKFRAD